ncbi:hypothetical protein ACQKDS_14595 [Serratia sp. NPDC078593]|uniref:phage tail fiber protein n=1 Tax=unclassified Serratia (in: enterobacteria) TaxID=2647522 RepID=UPI0037D83FC1
MAWYDAGTVSINGNTMVGTDTKWADNKYGIGPGCAVLLPGLGSVRIYEIIAVDSDTKIRLKSGPAEAITNAKYAILTFYTESRPDFARRLSAQLAYYQSQMDGWQEVMTGNGSIILEAPNGQQVTISSFKKLTSDMEDKADKSALGTAAGYNVQTHIGDKVENRVLIAGGYGLGIPAHAPASGWEEVNTNFSWNYTTNHLESYGGAGHELKMCMYSNEKINDFVSIFYVNRQSGNIGVVVRQLLISGNPTNSEVWRTEFRTTRNTSVDANGFIKQASPIARVTNNSEEMDANFLDGFTLAGTAAVNDEANGVHAERVSTGVYRISGAKGLAKEGWTIEVPQDVNGNRLCFVATETDADGTITVTVSTRRFDIDTAMVVAGKPMDIPPGRWIDLRLEM